MDKRIDNIAKWLYDRDASEWIREDWSKESKTFKEMYYEDARELLKILDDSTHLQ